MVTIRDIHAREVLDSRGNPTVEADVTLADGAPFPRVRREAIRAERAPTFAYAPEPLADAA